MPKDMKKKPAKKKFKCSKCGAKFADRFWLRQHFSREHKIHVSFLSLVNGYQNWGYTYETKKEADAIRKSPPDNAMILGYLELIVKELRAIKNEIGRERVLK